MSKDLTSFPKNREKRITLAVPASLVRDVPHLREKTSKIGMIGRAASIFRIDEIVIYLDRYDYDQRKDASLIKLILNYMETPQYLRKHIFKLVPELKFVGILPPLRTPHHYVKSRIEKIRVGDIREGVIVKSHERFSLIDVGLKKLVRASNQLKKGMRVAIKIEKVGYELRASIIKRETIEIYWGYRVIFSKLTLREVINSMNCGLIIMTSKNGNDVNEVLGEIRNKWSRSQKAMIIFGSPTHGIDEILAQDGIKTGDISGFRINTIPKQGVETIRTEEAIFASLSIINLLDQ